MQEHTFDLKVLIDGRQIFFLSQRIVCAFSGRLRSATEQERRKRKGGGEHSRIPELEFADFPGGPDGFEVAARFCYSKGRIAMSPSNICLLHCSAHFLEMTEELTPCNLLCLAETFLDGLFYWTWEDILASIRTCQRFFRHADSSGVLQRLLSSLIAKISANAELALTITSSSSSSPDVSRLRLSSMTGTPDTMKPCSDKEWWFDDLTILHPKVIEKLVAVLGSYRSDYRNLIVTRFLLHYLNKATAAHGSNARTKLWYGSLADTAVHGVVLAGRKAFSCRGLFWVLRIVSGLGLSRDCRRKLEHQMGMVLDRATLDDLLVCGRGPAYDVGLVQRLVKIFVQDGTVAGKNLKKVGRLLDMYLGEISPDKSLNVSAFLGLVESLPDSARDSYDGVYGALDIYLETHPSVSAENKARLCRCLNYEKLSPEACRDLAKNPRVPPRAAVHALLVSQRAGLQSGRGKSAVDKVAGFPWPAGTGRTAVCYKGAVTGGRLPRREEMKCVELEKKCREIKVQVSVVESENAGDDGHSQHRRRQQNRHANNTRGLPRLC